MSKIKVVINGFGNLGIQALDILRHTSDMECVGIVRRKESVGSTPDLLMGVQDYRSIEELVMNVGKPDVVVLCSPSRVAVEEAKSYLNYGINTVDSFDIHSEIVQSVETLEPVASEMGKVAIISAGWDPGTDSVIRAYLEAMAPVGTTFTNFGRGISMGHSVAARAIDGVKDARSITVPKGNGIHSRLVFVVLDGTLLFNAVKENITNDSYFSSDEIHINKVDSVEELEKIADKSHGVFIDRVGGNGNVSNQQFKFEMRINNPALTAQVLISCARATLRLSPGAYTLIDIPPIYLLPGERMDNIRRIV